jgi:two-component system response regulator YesN
MFKILIADDEQLEREALRLIISKSIDCISDIEEAVNGRDALAKVQASRPDIIILDINMPGINGIEAAWKIREKDAEVCIIFLTAFHQFDYAHEAIKIGVEDYIVKPSPEKRIIEVMEKVTAKLNERKKALILKENLEIRLDKATDYLSSEFIYNLATRNMTEERFRNYLTLLDMDFHSGRGLIMKMKYETYPIMINSEYQKDILKKRALRLLKDIVGQQGLRASVNRDLNNIFILISCSENHEIINSDTMMLTLCQKIIDKIQENLTIDVFLGCGSLIENSDQSLLSFTEAKQSDKKNKARLSQDILTESLPLELEMNLEQAVIAADKAKMEELFHQIEQWLQCSSEDFEKKKNEIKDLAAILRHAGSTQFPDGNCSISVEELCEADSIAELEAAFKGFLNELIEKIIYLFSRENTPAIKKACEFIKENYFREISLEDTARFCNLSTFYFSRIFKEHKNQNFINYLTEIRINEAKRLLKEENISMKEISEKIGYHDPNYFTRVFKRVENISPSDFRNNKMLKPQ